jgi:hypothetical protein
MKTRLCLLTALLGLAACASQPAAGVAAQPAAVAVVFAHPEKFTDVKDGPAGTDAARDNWLNRLKAHLERRGARCVPAGGRLALRITDVDRAGYCQPWHDDARVIKAVYPPRISLEFTLTGADGKILKQGRLSLQNLDFLQRLNQYSFDDDQRFEKQMLDDWLSAEFGRAKRPG